MRNILVESLKDYERKKATVDTALARIEIYKNAIENPKSYINIHYSSLVGAGSIKGKGGKPSSPVESEVIKKENDEILAIETLKEWIKDDTSRIHSIKVEVEQIDRALDSLTKEQRYIIECKYFDKMFWSDIEAKFNEKFGNHITERILQNRNKESLEKLCKILKPYYERRNSME